jgi:hypothetical protein
MANRTRDITYFYPTPESTGYPPNLADARFSILSDLSFKSVLDVGSGPCALHDWLKAHDYNGKYEAVDIRADSLALCDCPTYSEIPARKKYDLICLFGTVTYNIGENHQLNKNILLDLLTKAKAKAKKYIVFTVIKAETLKGLSALQLVGYSRNEVEDLASSLGSFTVIDDVDPDEYMVVVTV